MTPRPVKERDPHTTPVWLQGERPRLLDGAMGTMLLAAGLEVTGPLEQWNLTHPDLVLATHRAYVAAGSRMLLTNSIGGNAFRLTRHALDGQVRSINRAAARLARTVADETEAPVWVAGSLGPLGRSVGGGGDVKAAAARRAFAAQAAALAEGGVDLLWIETMSDLAEIRAAVQGARTTDLPIVVTLSPHPGAVSPTEAARALDTLEVAAIGVNCGVDLAGSAAALRQMRAAAPDLPLVAKPNAGLPRSLGAPLDYDVTPARFAVFGRQVIAEGVRLVGGCCGTTPAHIRALAEVIG